MKDKFWEAYIHRLCGKRPSRGKHHQLLVVLKTWTPQSPCRAQFLREFIRQFPPDRWMQWGTEVRHSILLELMRLDDGQGHIVPWLAAVIEHENSCRVLEAIGKWQLEKKITSAMLWDAWEKRSSDVSSSIGETAWHVLLSNQVDESGENTFVEPSGDGSVQRGIRLTELVLQRLPTESSPGLLEVIARWKPPLSVPVNLRMRLLQQWEEKARNVILSGKSPGAALTFEVRKAVWRGLTTVASVCPEGDDTVADIMETWFSSTTDHHGLDVRILSLMSTWHPRRGRWPAPLLLRWSQLLTAQKLSVRERAWRALGKGPGETGHAEDANAGDANAAGLDPEIWDNCLAGLECVFQSDSIFNFSFLCEVTPPSGLSLEQRRQWQETWMKKLSPARSQNGFFHLQRKKGAFIHLLRFGDPSLPGGEDLVQRLMETARDLLADGDDDGFCSFLFDRICSLEDCRLPALSSEVWRLLLQHKPLRVKAFQVLARKLNTSGVENQALELFSFWLSLWRSETNLAIVQQIGSLWHKTGMLPEILHHQMFSLWKERTADTVSEIRAVAWEALLPLGDEIGEFLLSRLKEERSPQVLSVMSRWKPSPELVSCSRFRAQFWASWGDVLSRLAGNPDNQGKAFFGVIGQNLLKLTVCDTDGREFFRHVSGQLKQISPSFEKEIACWHGLLDVLDALESPPEVFTCRLREVNKFNPVPKIIELFDLTASAAWSGCSANFRENSFFVAAAVLRNCIPAVHRDKYDFHGYRFHISKSLEVMRGLFHHEATHADGEEVFFLTGWDEIRLLLMETTPVDSVDSPLYELLHLCHSLYTPIQKKAFCRVLNEVRQSPGHRLALFADLVLWHNVCVAREMAQPYLVRACGHEIDGGIDPVAGRRWLREWIHTFCPGPEEMPPSDHRVPDMVPDMAADSARGAGLKPGFGSLLWETMEPALTRRAGKKPDFSVRHLCPPEMELSFRPLLKRGGVADEKVVPGAGRPCLHYIFSPVKDETCER